MDSVDVVKDFIDFCSSERSQSVDKEIADMWNAIPFLENDEYKDSKEVSNDGECPYCGQYVSITEDLEPPKNSIGKIKDGLYRTRFYRKCPHCGKIFYEDFGEEPDYEMW